MDEDVNNNKEIPFLDNYRSFFVLLSISVLFLSPTIKCQEIYTADVLWTSNLKLSEFSGYNTISLQSFLLPERVKNVFWDLQSYASQRNCPEKKVHFYFQHGSIPLVAPYNESYPEHFYLRDSKVLHKVVSTNNISDVLTINQPKPGIWFVAAFLPKGSTKKITQSGLGGGKTCKYGVSIRVISRVQEVIEEISTRHPNTIKISGHERTKTVRFFPSEGINRYIVSLSNCAVISRADSTNITNCPVYMDHSVANLPEESPSVDCSQHTPPCQITLESPNIHRWSYLKFSTPRTWDSNQELEFQVSVIPTYCKINDVEILVNYSEDTDKKMKPMNSTFEYNATEISVSTPHGVKDSNHTCFILPSLGRIDQVQLDFIALFRFPDMIFYPQLENKLFVPDSLVLVTYLDLETDKDAGGTLKVEFKLSPGFVENDQEAFVMICLLPNAIPNELTISNCSGGLGIKLNSSSLSSTSKGVYIPYPETTRWYIGMISQCVNRSKSSVTEKCSNFPVISFKVTMSKCVDNQCGRYGKCQEYISGHNIFSACKCYAGWRGYGCTDGTEAESDTQLLISTLFLTLSNLLFIPSIIIATYRRYFVEALVYLFTMFFSTFYHACDTSSKLYSYCMMDYNVLSFCDFLGSIMSFWVTIIAMAKVTDRLKGFLHVLGALGLSFGVEYARHGLWVFVVPTTFGLFIMLVSWIRKCKTRHKLYPSKYRYLFYLLPGLIFAGTGLVIFAFFETDDNYKYTHSAWHMVMALSISFLLPPRYKKSKVTKVYIDPSDRAAPESTSLLRDENDAIYNDDATDNDDATFSYNHRRTSRHQRTKEAPTNAVDDSDDDLLNDNDLNTVNDFNQRNFIC